jgi:hypothetical protein
MVPLKCNQRSHKSTSGELVSTGPSQHWVNGKREMKTYRKNQHKRASSNNISHASSYCNRIRGSDAESPGFQMAPHSSMLMSKQSAEVPLSYDIVAACLNPRGSSICPGTRAGSFWSSNTVCATSPWQLANVHLLVEKGVLVPVRKGH